MSTVDVARQLWLLVAALGLALPVVHGGQPVLGAGAAVAVGGYGTTLLADRAGWPLGLAVLAAVAVGGLAGWVVGLATARLRDGRVALATWALAFVVIGVLDAYPSLSGGPQGLTREAPARLVSEWLGIVVELPPLAHCALAAATAGLLLLATRSVVRGPIGLDLAAVRAGDSVAAVSGVRGAVLSRWLLAAAFAASALAGAGIVTLLGVIAPSDVSPVLSVELYAAVLLGGSRLLGPVLGVAVLATVPALADGLASLAGTSADRARPVLAALLLLVALSLRSARPGAVTPLRPAPLPAAAADAKAPAVTGEIALVARGIGKSYGGLVVLDGVDLELRAGEVHALVGGNGSGKTTLLRVLSGALPPDAGAVLVGGVDVTGVSEPARVARGVVRTAQAPERLPGLDVVDQARLGARVVETHGRAWRTLLRTPSWSRAHVRAERSAADALDLVGLRDVSGSADALPLGEVRLLQVARALASGATVLLLDEPAAGTSPEQRTRLAAAVRAAATYGAAVLVVEHDLRFVASVAQSVTVLDRGQVLLVGTPDEVRRDPRVRAAWLGGAQ